MDPILQEVIRVYRNVKLTGYAEAVGVTIICYDLFLAASDEVEFIWSMPRWTVKILFYLNRILSFSYLLFNAYHFSNFRPQLSNTLCKWSLSGMSFAALIAFGCVTWILMLRVFALYERHRWVVWSMSILFVCAYGTSLAFVTIAVLTIFPELHYSPITNTCLFTSRLRVFTMIWAAPVAMDVIIFILATWKMVSNANRSARTSFKTQTPVWQTLFRDGLIHFIVITTLIALNMLAWILLEPSLNFVAFYPLWGLMSAILTRLLINLRKAGTVESYTEYNITTIGGTNTFFIVTNHDFRPDDYEMEPYALGDSVTP